MISHSICDYIHHYTQHHTNPTTTTHIKLNITTGYLHLHWGW